MSSHQLILPQDGQPDEAALPRLLYVTHAQYSTEWNSTLHTHACAELFFILSGHGSFWVQKDRFPVAAGDLVVINASIPHTETSQHGSPMEYVVLGAEGLETLTDISGCALLHLPGEQAGIFGALEIMVREARAERPGCCGICQRLLEVILLQLQRRADFAVSAAPERSRSSRECALVRRYIDTHFKENLSLDQLAGLAHINKYYLSHAFRKEFGTSPISYLHSRRIQESRFLLSETDHSLSQIARILGFSSLSYFSQSFRRLEGVSPMEYRKRCRQQGGRC